MEFSGYNRPGRVPLLLSIMAILIGTLVLGIILLHLKVVLIPLAVALLLSIVFRPIVRFLKERRVPDFLSLAIVAVALMLAIMLPGYLVYASAMSLTRNLDTYVPRIESLISGIEEAAVQLAARINVDLAEVDFSQIIDVSSIASVVTGTVGETVALVANVFLVLLFMLFMLAGASQLEGKIRKAYPEAMAARINQAIDRISRQVRRYLVAKALISAGTGVIVTLALWLLGVDFPVFWGFLAFVLNFIPTVGDLVSTLLPTLLALLQFETLVIPVLCCLSLVLIQAVMGNVLQPRIVGSSLNLSPAVVLVSLIFWAWFWGIPGMILAIPLTATVRIVFENIEGLRPLATLMGAEAGGKPAPVHSPDP